MPILDHASVRITDLDRSREFYEGLLGFRQATRPDLGFPGAWYDLGQGQLHLIQTGKMFEEIDPTDPHIAVAVDSFVEVKRRLQERGIPFLEFGSAQLWIRDPDGNVIEVCERR